MKNNHAMKRYLVLALLLALAAPVAAQHDGRQQGQKKRADITELVSDLSAPQKRKIENISQKSKERIEELRKQQRAVLDSIHTYMDMDGDQSKLLYPLFDREAQLHVAIDREMYATKLRIDEVLTKEQRATLRQALHSERSSNSDKTRPKSHPARKR